MKETDFLTPKEKLIKTVRYQGSPIERILTEYLKILKIKRNEKMKTRERNREEVFSMHPQQKKLDTPCIDVTL